MDLFDVQEDARRTLTVIPQICLNLALHHRSELDPPTAGKTSSFSLTLCLFVPVAALPTVAPNLTAINPRIN